MIGANGQRREHCSADALCVLLFDPSSREDDKPYSSTRTFGEPLPQDAAGGPEGVEKRYDVLWSESGIYDLPG